MMRITIISTPIGFLSSGEGGGVELTLNSLVSGLLDDGHQVRVIAPEKSRLSDNCKSAQLICVRGRKQKSWQHQKYDSKIVLTNDSIVKSMLDKALSFKNDSDVIVNLSYDYLPIHKTLDLDIPLLHLISMGDESFEIKKIISEVYFKYPNNFGFHTRSQASDYPFIERPLILGNGFDLSNYKFNNTKNGPLAWVGRVAPEKGLEDATYVANKIGEMLNVWGVIQDQNYLSKIENLYSSKIISWKGFLKTQELQKGLGRCRALINTPKWNEAYGNVVVEALACGVPVISYAKGGPSEIIKHGETGYLVDPDDKEGLVKYLNKINNINRKNCRDWVEKNASTKIFTDKVVTWLKKVIKEYN
tara:strand:+ start:1528 stop:2607 length:1080 start_codon:yes stop_codon:yes gene_type:complete